MTQTKNSNGTTHFGYQTVSVEDKAEKVADVFHSVADQYDLMNDLMSFGVHRIWKRMAISFSGVRPGDCVLDLAGGSGDLTRLLLPKVGETGRVVLSDINASMLEVGRKRLLDDGIFKGVEFVQANAESLPWGDDQFDVVTMAFGLRNVTHKDRALSEIQRVLRPGGQALILEFSKPTSSLLNKVYDTFSFSVLPHLGKMVADDEDSYRYLAESIRKHPNQNEMKELALASGFDKCEYHNFTGGIVALHRCWTY